jgi:hypothetical protein
MRQGWLRLIPLAYVVLATTSHATDPEPNTAAALSARPTEQPSTRSRAIAAAREAKSHFDRGEFQLALDAFLKAKELATTPVVDLYIARSERALGHFRNAELGYNAALAVALDGTNAAWLSAQRDAVLELASLQREMPHLSVVAPEPPLSTPNVTLDGVSTGWPIHAVAIDPGQHVLVLDTSGKTIERSFVAHAGAGVTLVIQWPSPETPPSPPKAIAPAAHKVNLESPPARALGPDWKPWMWSAWGLGAVAVGVGTVTGIVVLNEANSLREWCAQPEAGCTNGKPVDQPHLDAQRNAEILAVVSDVSFVTAGIAALGGLAFFVLDRNQSARSSAFLLEPRLGGLGLSGRF